LLQRVVAERPAAAGGEQRVAWFSAAFGEPGPQRGDGAGGERGDPVFAAFAVAGGVGTVAEVNVADGQAGEFGGPQPGLGGEQDPGVVAAAGAGGPVGAASSAAASSSVR
jgi:hypothetical protein